MPATSAEHEAELTAPAPPVFPKVFAGLTALLVGLSAAALLVLADVFESRLGLTGQDWRQLGAGGRLATTVLMPLIALGVTALAVGLWMALVEWQGKFCARSTGPTAAPRSSGGEGRLSGAVPVLIAGVLLLLGAAWVASAAAVPQEAAPRAPAGDGEQQAPAG
jgi:hypothetical protein